MKSEFDVLSEVDAVEELAHLLHVRQQTVTKLLERDLSPLPRPPVKAPDNCFYISSYYLKRLRSWLRQERESTTRSSAITLDFVQIERELSEAEKAYLGYDFRQSFPPGYFLG